MSLDRLLTVRLDGGPAADADPAEFTALFNLDDPPVLTTDGGLDQPRHLTDDDVRMYLWQESVRSGSHCYGLRDRVSRSLVGTLAVLVPNPDDGVPWVGLLLVAKPLRGQGLGGEILDALHSELATQGWPSVKCAVVQESPAVGFWRRHGYTDTGDGRDDAGRLVTFLQRSF